MLKLKLENEHKPVLTYEIVVDFGEDGTRTVYDSDSLAKTTEVFNLIVSGDLDIFNLDLNENELEDIKAISINIALTAKELDLIYYGNVKSAMAEIQSFKVVKE